MSTQKPPGIWQTCNHSKKSGGAHRTSRSQPQSLPAESASKSRWAFRSAGMSVGGSFGGELTFACLEPRPARPRRKLEAECSRCGTYKRGGMLRQARFEFVRGQRQRTGVQGKPGPESVVVSGLCCVSTVVVNRCSEHLSEPRPGHNWKLADDLPETNRELAGLRGLPDRSSGVVDCGRVLYPLPQSTAVYRVDGRGFTPQTQLNSTVR